MSVSVFFLYGTEDRCESSFYTFAYRLLTISNIQDIISKWLYFVTLTVLVMYNS